MKTDYEMDYSNPKKSGQIAFLRGHRLEDNPCSYRTSANARTAWIQGWHKQSKIKCKGIELQPGVMTGCTQTDGDCPVCDK
jgi:hypothetical protein